jgi:hypothetical protein
MTMQDEWTDRLSDYLDDELAADERHALELHLSGCESCRQTLEELKAVVTRARSVAPRLPKHDLWAGVSQRIAPGAQGVAVFRRHEPRRVSFTFPQLAAAGVLLALLSGGLAWKLLPRSPLVKPSGPGQVAIVEPISPAPDTSTPYTVEPVSLADKQYDAAVADLQRALAKGRGRLDRGTISIVEQNLQIIDRAIGQATAALIADPGNTYLTGHLVEARRKKLDLLRRAAALASETD